MAHAAGSLHRYGVASLVLLILLALVVLAFRRPDAPSAAGVQIVPLTFDGPGIANQFPQASPDGRYIVFQRCDKPGVSQSAAGKTVFTFKEGSDWDVYRMRVDGTERVRLTDSPEVEDEPTYSPDGRTIAYRAVRNGSSSLFLMDADGQNKRPLIADPNMDLKTPAFSPDGRQILFYGDGGKAGSHLFTVDLANRAMHQLTTGPFEDKHPQFLAEGAAVIFHSNRRGIEISLKGQAKRTPAMSIFSLTLGTGQIRPLLPDGGGELQDSRHSFVSRDGRFIVYHAQTFGADPQHAGRYRRMREDIYVMTRDGQRRVNVTEHDWRYFKHPSWSADGRGIYCVFNDKRGEDVWNVAYIDVTAALRQLM